MQIVNYGKQSETLYELVGKEQWHEKAKEFKYCALILYAQLRASIATPPNKRRLETLGLFNCTLLLFGLAFENLIKGVYVARKPTLVDKSKLELSEWRTEKGDSGHEILKLAKALMPLDKDEEDLLGRLQEAIIWSSRFPIPTKSQHYESRYMRQLLPQNIEVVEGLFKKLEELLLEARSANSPS